MGGSRESQGFPSQGNEGIRQNIVLDEGPQASVIKSVEDKIYKVINPQVSLDSSQLSEYNDVIHGFARSLTLRCQSVLASHQSIIFAGATPAARNKTVMTKLDKMAANIATHFAEQFLLKVMKGQELADGRTSYRVLYARLISDFYLSQIDSIELTEEGFKNQDDIALHPNKVIEGLKNISEFLTMTPAANLAKEVAKIAVKRSFQPENIRRMAVNRYRHITDGSDDVSFVGDNDISHENVKVIIAMSRMDAEQRKQVYMQMIGLTNGGNLNFGHGGAMMEHDLKALKLGILMGDFTPISFKAFVYKHSPSTQRVRNVRYIDNFLSTQSGRGGANGVSSGFDMYNLDNQDQTNLGFAEDLRQAHVSQGHIGETIYYGALHLNALVSFGVNLSELATIAKQAGQGQKFTPEQVQSAFTRMGINPIGAALGRMTEFANQIAAVAQPIAFILVSTFASMVATRKMANPSRSLDVVVDEVFNDFKDNNIIRTITNDPDTSKVTVPLVKKTFSNTIMKASYLSTKGFAVLHRQSVLNSLGQTARNSSNSYPTLASFLNSLNQQDRNDFIKYVLPSFSDVEDRSAFWSDFILEYSLLSSIMPSRDQILMVYDNDFPDTSAGSAYTTNVLLSDNRIQPSSAGDEPIPQFAYSRHATRQGNRYRLADRSASAPYTSSYRSLESFDVERTNLINRDKVFRLTEAQRSTLATYGISHRVDSTTKEGILTYSPALTPGSNPQTFRVVENLRQRRMVWGKVESIDENANTNTIVINSKNFRPIIIPFQTIPVMPQTPFQRVDNYVLPHSISEVLETGSDNTIATLRYLEASSLKVIFPGVQLRDNIPQDLTVQKVVEMFNQVREDGELSRDQYKVLQILLRQRSIEMNGSQIQAVTSKKDQLLRFKAAPSSTQPVDMASLNQNSDFEFIKEGEKIGIFVRSYEEVFRQMPVLLSHSENKEFNWTMQDVYDYLDEKSEEEWTPVEALIYQRLDDMDEDLLVQEFLIEFPYETYMDFPNYGLIQRYSDGPNTFKNIPNPSGYFISGDELSDIRFHKGQIQFKKIDKEEGSASLEIKQAEVRVYEQDQIHNMTLNNTNPFALVKINENKYVLYTKEAGLTKTNDALIDELWTAENAGYAAAILRNLNVQLNNNGNEFSLGATMLTVSQVGDLSAPETLAIQESISLSPEDIQWFKLISGGIELNPNQPPLLTLNPSNAFNPYLPSPEFFINVSTEKTNKIIQKIKAKKIPIQLKAFTEIPKQENPSGSPKLPGETALAGKTFVEALNQLNADPSRFDVRVFHLLRMHYGLSVNDQGIFVLPDAQLSKSFSGEALTVDNTPTSSLDVISQRQKALIGINAQGNFDFSYPYYPIAPADKTLANASFNEITFDSFVYVDVANKKGYVDEGYGTPPEGANIDENIIKNLQRDPLSADHTQFLNNLGISISGENGRIIYGYPMTVNDSNYAAPQSLTLENSYLPLGNISNISYETAGTNLVIKITVLHPNGQTTVRRLELPKLDTKPVPFYEDPDDVEDTDKTYIVRQGSTLDLHYQGVSFPESVSNVDSLIGFLNEPRDTQNQTLNSIRQTLLEQGIVKVSTTTGLLEKEANAPTNLNLTLNTQIESAREENMLAALNFLLGKEDDTLLRSLPASFEQDGRKFIFRNQSYFLDTDPKVELILNHSERDDKNILKIDNNKIIENFSISNFASLPSIIFTHRLLSSRLDGVKKIDSELTKFKVGELEFSVSNKTEGRSENFYLSHGTEPEIKTQFTDQLELNSLINAQNLIKDIPEETRNHLRAELLKLEVIESPNQQIPFSFYLDEVSFTLEDINEDNQLVYINEDSMATLKVYPNIGYVNQFDLYLNVNSTDVYPFTGKNTQERISTLNNGLDNLLNSLESTMPDELPNDFTYHETPADKYPAYPVIKSSGNNLYALEKEGSEFKITQVNPDLNKPENSLSASNRDLNKLLEIVNFHESVSDSMRAEVTAFINSANNTLDQFIPTTFKNSSSSSIESGQPIYNINNTLRIRFTDEGVLLENLVGVEQQNGRVKNTWDTNTRDTFEFNQTNEFKQRLQELRDNQTHRREIEGVLNQILNLFRDTVVIDANNQSFQSLSTNNDFKINYERNVFTLITRVHDNPDNTSQLEFKNKEDLILYVRNHIELDGINTTKASSMLQRLGLMQENKPFPREFQIKDETYRRSISEHDEGKTQIQFKSPGGESASYLRMILDNNSGELQSLIFNYRSYKNLIQADAEILNNPPFDDSLLENLIINQQKLFNFYTRFNHSNVSLQKNETFLIGVGASVLAFDLGFKSYEITYSNKQYLLKEYNSQLDVRTFNFNDTQGLTGKINELATSYTGNSTEDYQRMVRSISDDETGASDNFNTLLTSIGVEGGIQPAITVSGEEFNFLSDSSTENLVTYSKQGVDSKRINLSFKLEDPQSIELRYLNYTTQDAAEIQQLSTLKNRLEEEYRLINSISPDGIDKNLDRYPFSFSKGDASYTIQQTSEGIEVMPPIPEGDDMVFADVIPGESFDTYVQEIALFTPEQIQERKAYFNSIGLTENEIENKYSLQINGQEYERRINGNRFIYSNSGVELTFTKRGSSFSLTNLKKGEFQYPLPSMSSEQTKAFLTNFNTVMQNFQIAINKALELTSLHNVSWEGGDEAKNNFILKISNQNYILMYNGTNYSLEEQGDDSPSRDYVFNEAQLQRKVLRLANQDVRR
ncbi:hypothetical protein HOJ01_03880 [bacterium]|jgi:hypothetical protein|nr:hypothetical protein [bacterium]MBT6293919.1 hypothetical protein [bacterium]